MKKLLTLCLAAMGLLVASPGQADNTTNAVQQQWSGQQDGQQHDGHQYAGQEFCCGDVQEHPCGDSYCLYCKYEPCYYNEWHTVCEPQCYQKKCCRYVPKQYEKCCVKYVPQYYNQTCCRYEPEYFYTTETRNVSRKVCEKKCKYVPKYYYKHICSPAPACDTGCAQ